MTSRDAQSKRRILGRCRGIAALLALTAAPAAAKVEVTENFNIGSGTRLETFVGNNPAPQSIPTLTFPVDGASVNMGFGAETLTYSAVKTNQFGLTTTNHVGAALGAPGTGVGEFGGMFNWLDYGYAADTNIGNLTMGAGTLEDPIRVQAKMTFLPVGGGNDETVTIGYFKENLGLNEPINAVGNDDDMRRAGEGLSPHTTISGGIGFISDGRFFLWVGGADSPVQDFRSAETPVRADGTPIHIDLGIHFVDDEFLGQMATISGTVNGNAVSMSRASNAGETLGVFGIGQSYKRPSPKTQWRRSLAFFDDVTYSVDVDGGIDNPDPSRFSDLVVDDADFDGDLDVDGDDFLIWQRGLGIMGGATKLQGDANNDGNVDAADLAVWRGGFGGNSISAVTQIPEPSSLTLLGVLGLTALRVRRRRRTGAIRA